MDDRHKSGAVINRIGPNFGKPQCDYCVRVWPCDASVYRARADKAEESASKFQEQWRQAEESLSRLSEFVYDCDPAIMDAFFFTENNRGNT